MICVGDGVKITVGYCIIVGKQLNDGRDKLYVGNRSVDRYRLMC